MTQTIDPLEGVRADHIVRARVACPEHAILADDELLIDTKGTPMIGQLVVVLVDGKAAVRRFEEGARVLGRVAAVVRTLA